MFLVISGTNRPASRTRQVAELALRELRLYDSEAALLDLLDLPGELLTPAAYAAKPAGFAPFQQAILDAEGILTVTPEYNGGFPGILKYFIDMLKFPESLYEKPAAFIGLSAGTTGAIRPIDQLMQIYQYRSAHIYGRRLLLPKIGEVLDDWGEFVDGGLRHRLEELIPGFVRFTRAYHASRAKD